MENMGKPQTTDQLTPTLTFTNMNKMATVTSYPSSHLPSLERFKHPTTKALSGNEERPHKRFRILHRQLEKLHREIRIIRLRHMLHGIQELVDLNSGKAPSPEDEVLDEILDEALDEELVDEQSGSGSIRVKTSQVHVSVPIHYPDSTVTIQSIIFVQLRTQPLPQPPRP
ncbi:uncharacterized protein BJX67DRAFT_383042 [Aspergillus lucknowensis]|uniref:Uncharacterized protein n=1 Tax=Aspergillus lucknowensis TaxID=176173 RepID=A0ABR4LLG5_9EURO